MKPSLDVLKNSRDRCREMAESYTKSAAEYDAQIAEEEREAKAKEWPQEGDEFWITCFGVGATRNIYTSSAAWMVDGNGRGVLYRTPEDCKLVDDFLRSRPRGWLLAMAKLGNAFSVWKSPDGIRNSGDAVNLSSTYEIDKWDALTEDERAALLGQGMNDA